jgi:predicted RNA binding protein YcfA (HicA-like mRNA interferase family)
MGLPKQIWDQIKNVSKDRLIKALLDDGFLLDEEVKTERCYRHKDRRRVMIHYHKGSDTFGPGLLQKMLKEIGWSEKDYKRLKLAK